LIKAVIFDFGGTLVRGKLDERGYRQRLLNYIHSLGYRVSERSLRKAIEGMLVRLMKTRKRNLELRFEDLYSNVLSKLGINPSEEMLINIYGLYKKSFSFEIVQGAEEVLQTLYGRYKLAVVSNTMSEIPRFALTDSGLMRFFQIVILSRDIGIRKPDPRIFWYALEKLNVKPKEAIHVGDSIKHDVVGAKNAGIKAAWIKIEGKKAAEEPDHVIHSINELPKVINLY